MKIGFIQFHDPMDRRASSGTTYKMAEALRMAGNEVVWVKARKNILYRTYSKVMKFWNGMSRAKVNVSHSSFGSSLLSMSLDRSIIDSCDILFAPFASECLYKLKTDRPIVYLSDATFGIMAGYYYKNLSPCSVRQGNKVEQVAVDKAAEVIVSSDWAAESVVKDYHKDPSKVHVLEFGANVDEKDIAPKVFEYDGHLDILFLGVDWDRKGGGIAVDAARWLNGNDVPTTLHIVGIKNLAPEVQALPFVDNHGNLNKNIPEEYQKLVEVMRKCHCLLLPTLAECAGIAFCESCANGLPIFSHRTGGVSDYVHDGENGYLLPSPSSGEDFGRKIKSSLESGEMARMSETAKHLYRSKFNWKVWAEKMMVIMSALDKGSDSNDSNT